MPGPYGIGHRAGCFENRHGGNQPDAACGKRTANPEAVPSSSSGATRADVSITNEIALRAVPEYLLRGAAIQQGQRRNAAGKIPHSRDFAVGPTLGIPAAEFGADGVEDGGRGLFVPRHLFD